MEAISIAFYLPVEEEDEEKHRLQNIPVSTILFRIVSRGCKLSQMALTISKITWRV